MRKKLKNLERDISSRLNKYPAVKAVAKKVYTTPFRIWGRAAKKSVWQVDKIEIGESGKQSFFGYYDLWPENDDGLVLSHQAKASTSRAPDPNVPIEVVVFPPDAYSKPLLTRHTVAYNWQQGSRLQWIDNDRFIYNDFEPSRNSYVARMVSINNFKTETLALPVQCLINSQSYLAINYQRLARLRPDYGYFNLDPKSVDLNELAYDGVWKYEIEHNRHQLLYSLRNIVMASGVCMDQIMTKHKVNHLLMAPDKFRFAMIHRQFAAGKRSGYLLIGDIEGGPLTRLSTGRIVSHYCWMSNAELLVFMDGENGFRYYMINTLTGHVRPLMELAGPASRDGHPTDLGSNLFVADTYPDRFGYQSLFLGNAVSGSTEILAVLKHPSNYSGIARCDLHPRTKPGFDYGFLDSVYSGTRRQYRFKL